MAITISEFFFLIINLEMYAIYENRIIQCFKYITLSHIYEFKVSMFNIRGSGLTESVMRLLMEQEARVQVFLTAKI